MKKIVFLPLDERPCNVKFPQVLFDGKSFTVVCPPEFGSKKEPADFHILEEFLLRECRNGDGLVLSVDMLLYGGLVPSRLHRLTNQELFSRLELIRELKRVNPALKIYAFHCIMRCPTYSSADEEPDYYGQYGEAIHKLGAARHKVLRGEEEARGQAEGLESRIPWEYLEDYLARRTKNLELNLAMLTLMEEGVAEFLVVPQDDAAPLGFTAMDQEQVRRTVREKRLQHKVLIYPGADELGLTLLARMRNELENRCPGVFVQYASEEARFVVPPYEDRPLGETVRYQLAAAGCRPVVAPEEADFILAMTAPGANMVGAAVQPRLDLDYDVRRSLSPFFTELCYWLDAGKPVSICDNAYTNGGDLELLSMLDASGRLMQVAGYAGWNTSANTMGTAIAEGVRYLYEGRDAVCLDFLALRYLEDCGYDAMVRQSVTAEELPALGMSYFNVKERDGVAAACVKNRLEDFLQKHMKSLEGRVTIERVQMPWRRMFEADITVRYLP